MKYTCSALCDVGKVRKNNEDNLYINGIYRESTDIQHFEHRSAAKDMVFLVGVFDGMGGEEDGELASLEAAKRLGAYQDKDFSDIVDNFVSEANNAICTMMNNSGSGKRMGSTLAIVRIENDSFSFCNIGDSPIYLFRGGSLEQLSLDHNEAQSLFEMGIISKEQVKTDKHKNRLTQHLGIEEDEMIIEPFVSADNRLDAGDRILICSDGLTDMVSEKEIEKILSNTADADEVVHILFENAINNGGRDNTTIILVDISE